jgi:hypothetical protein
MPASAGKSAAVGGLVGSIRISDGTRFGRALAAVTACGPPAEWAISSEGPVWSSSAMIAPE